MNRLLVLGLVVLLACTAYAGGNPDARIYLDFDPPNYVHEFTPTIYTEFSVFVCLDQLGQGMTTVSFRLTNLQEEYPGMFPPPSIWSLLPGGLPIWWSVWDEPGATFVSSECMGAGGEPLPVAEIRLFSLGYSACLEILDHTEYTRWVVDCSEPGEVDQYCVLAHGSIGGEPCPDGDCDSVAVQGASWGSIKSLYR